MNPDATPTLIVPVGAMTTQAAQAPRAAERRLPSRFPEPEREPGAGACRCSGRPPPRPRRRQRKRWYRRWWAFRLPAILLALLIGITALGAAVGPPPATAGYIAAPAQTAKATTVKTATP